MLCQCGCGHPAPIAKRTNTAKGHIKGQPVRLIRGHFDAETRARISASKRGQTVDPDTRAKISATLTGRTDPPEVREKKIAAAQRGGTSPVWVGENASYNTVHNRARLALPQECEHADGTCRGILEVALRHGLPAEFVRVSERGHSFYIGARISDGYMRLCRSHHRRHDA